MSVRRTAHWLPFVCACVRVRVSYTQCNAVAAPPASVIGRCPCCRCRCRVWWYPIPASLSLSTLRNGPFLSSAASLRFSSAQLSSSGAGEGKREGVNDRQFSSLSAAAGATRNGQRRKAGRGPESMPWTRLTQSSVDGASFGCWIAASPSPIVPSKGTLTRIVIEGPGNYGTVERRCRGWFVQGLVAWLAGAVLGPGKLHLGGLTEITSRPTDTMATMLVPPPRPRGGRPSWGKVFSTVRVREQGERERGSPQR